MKTFDSCLLKFDAQVVKFEQRAYFFEVGLLRHTEGIKAWTRSLFKKEK